MELAPANIWDWKQAATSFENVGIYKNYSASMVGASEPDRVGGVMIGASLFPTLGVPAALGRTFTAEEDSERAPKTAILSDSLWRAAFGAEPNVLGRTIVLDDEAHTVIGVMPPGFSFPNRDAEIWVPMVLTADDIHDRNNNEFYAVARLKPGATLDSARAEMDVLAARSRRQYPKENEGTGVILNDLRVELSEEARVTVLALSGAAFCVLLIVCANLANLLLARALGRRQELAVRAALGAGRERLVRQLATESVVLAAIGGALGVLLAVVLVPTAWRMVPADLPTSVTPGVDLRVLGFAAILTIVTTLAFGLAPMLSTGADGHAAGLREGARSLGGHRGKLRGALVVGEVVASVVLLAATGLLVRALWNIQGTDPGFRPQGVLTLRTDIGAQYVVTARRADYYNRVLEQVRALPGVTNAAYISGLPMVWGGGIWPVGINGVEVERRDDNTASMRFATPGFFATLGVPIKKGRDVSDSDTMTTQMTAVVSESFVKRYWPGQDALGRQFNLAGIDRTIVGVVSNIRVRGLERDSEPQVYLPYRQVRDGRLWGYTPKELVISATTPLEPLVPAVRSIIRTIDPRQPITNLRPMTDIIDAQTASRSVQVRVLAGFALVAFLLAAIGIHGVLAFAVSQRTPEIGVRIALGAQRADILRMVMRQGVLLVAAGLLPGLALAYAAGRSLQSLLAGVAPADAMTFAAVVGLTLLMALAGTLLPALRALRIDPLTAIRRE
jgi:predicted permease